MIVVSYTWGHLRSGHSGLSEQAFLNERHFERVLAHWNWQQPSTWAYARSVDAPVRPASREEGQRIYPQHCY